MPERPFSKQTSMSNSKNTQHHTFASVVYYFPTLLPIRGSKQGLTVQGTKVKDEAGSTC